MVKPKKKPAPPKAKVNPSLEETTFSKLADRVSKLEEKLSGNKIALKPISVAFSIESLQALACEVAELKGDLVRIVNLLSTGDTTLSKYKEIITKNQGPTA